MARDRPGLLARQTAALADRGVDVIGAISAVWGDGCSLSSFLVQADREPVAAGLDRVADPRPRAARCHRSPTSGVTLAFDDDGSPWHTICTVRARDQRGLLHAVTTAFAAAGVNVHAARIRTAGDTVVDVFELTDGKGQKLSVVHRGPGAHAAGGRRGRAAPAFPQPRRAAGQRRDADARVRRPSSYRQIVVRNPSHPRHREPTFAKPSLPTVANTGPRRGTGTPANAARDARPPRERRTNARIPTLAARRQGSGGRRCGHGRHVAADERRRVRGAIDTT